MASAAVPVTYPWHERAPVCGSHAALATLRSALEQCEFTAEAICRRLGLADVAAFQSIRQGRAELPLDQPLDVLIRLLLDGEFVERAVLESMLPPGVLPVMEALGLLADAPAAPGKWYGTVRLFPVLGQWLASDRGSAPDGRPYSMPADVVYPAAVENTREFMATLPDAPCEAFLDLGTGTGIAAFDAARRYARHAWATDIAPRSLAFARFNRWLNGVENVTLLKGDLYQPVEGLTFDRIAAHLPYVPSRRNRLIFRDGGEDGEEILARTVAGLPRVLRPGGRFQTLVTAADCEDESLDDRLRRWLGGDAPQFDIVMVAHRLVPPKSALASLLGFGGITMDEWRYDRELWERRKVTFLFHGSICIRRHGRSRPGFTSRLLKGQDYRQEHAEWLLEWETAIHDPAAMGKLLGLRPSLSPSCEMAVFHAVRDGRFVPQGYSLRSSAPFESECICQPWLVQILSACNGRATWRELCEKARCDGVLDAATTPEEFVILLGPMVANGFLNVP